MAQIIYVHLVSSLKSLNEHVSNDFFGSCVKSSLSKNPWWDFNLFIQVRSRFICFKVYRILTSNTLEIITVFHWFYFDECEKHQKFISLCSVSIMLMLNKIYCELVKKKVKSSSDRVSLIHLKKNQRRKSFSLLQFDILINFFFSSIHSLLSSRYIEMRTLFCASSCLYLDWWIFFDRSSFPTKDIQREKFLVFI